MKVSSFSDKEPKETTTSVSGIFSYTDDNSDVLKDNEVNNFYANKELEKKFNEQQFEGHTSSPLANYKKIKVDLNAPMNAEKFIM